MISPVHIVEVRVLTSTWKLWREVRWQNYTDAELELRRRRKRSRKWCVFHVAVSIQSLTVFSMSLRRRCQLTVASAAASRGGTSAGCHGGLTARCYVVAGSNGDDAMGRCRCASLQSGDNDWWPVDDGGDNGSRDNVDVTAAVLPVQLHSRRFLITAQRHCRLPPLLAMTSTASGCWARRSLASPLANGDGLSKRHYQIKGTKRLNGWTEAT